MTAVGSRNLTDEQGLASKEPSRSSRLRVEVPASGSHLPERAAWNHDGALRPAFQMLRRINPVESRRFFRRFATSFTRLFRYVLPNLVDDLMNARRFVDAKVRRFAVLSTLYQRSAGLTLLFVGFRLQIYGSGHASE